MLLPVITGNDYKNIFSKSVNSTDPEAPDPPTITGPTEGKLREKYRYEIITNDPQCDDLCFTIRCSDMPLIYNSDWCCSGDVFIFNHSWDDYYQKSGPFIISAKAIDCEGHESEWGTLEINIEKNKNIYYQFIERLIARFPLLEILLN
jgi:hypothetical protein